MILNIHINTYNGDEIYAFGSMMEELGENIFMRHLRARSEFMRQLRTKKSIFDRISKVMTTGLCDI